jgi:hypothetical protein
VIEWYGHYDQMSQLAKDQQGPIALSSVYDFKGFGRELCSNAAPIDERVPKFFILVIPY